MNDPQVAVDSEIVRPSRKKSIWVAFALSLLTPGLGQFYVGKPLRGVFFYAANYVILILCSRTGLMDALEGLVLLVGATVTWRLYTIADAMLLARKELPKGSGQIKWYALIAIGIGMLVVSALTPFELVSDHRTFSITSSANTPSILAGDNVVADMGYYDDHVPDYGDLIVYKGSDGLYYTFRVVGLGGDNIKLQNDVPVINGIPNPTEYLRDTNLTEGPAEIYQETFPNDKSHEIIVAKTKWTGAIVSTSEIAIPDGYVYVMGDSRDNAIDSRYSGLIYKWDIEGKCMYVYWSHKLSRIGTRLDL